MAKDLLYAKTQRIVLLIDLDPILHLPYPAPYLAVVFSAAEKLLSFSPLSSSLFSFKFFFSSFSPLLSSSKLSGLSLSSPSLSFDLPCNILVSLSRAFDALKRSDLRSSSSSAASSARGVHVAASIRQIVYDYNWELAVQDPVIGTIPGLAGDGFDIVKSNLVVLFSPLSRDLEWVSQFLDVGIEDECLSDLNMFKSKLRGIFDSVNDLFLGRDIQLSWADVKCEVNSGEGSTSKLKLGFLESGVKELNWGFCSTDSIILGSSVVPFGLIYPAIGIPPNAFISNEDCRKFHVQSSLEIVDVNGKPLECKCSELELVYLSNRSEEFINLANRSKEQFGGITKIIVKTLRMCHDLAKLGRYAHNSFVVREITREFNQEEDLKGGFWADRVLQIVANETGGIVVRKSLPIWQILLSFLYQEGYSVLVTLSDSNGGSWMGILKPFTVSSALISVLDNGVSLQAIKQEIHSKEVCSREQKRKLGKKGQNLQDITWAEFCESAKSSDTSGVGLKDAYFSKFSKSKKMKFLKCWLKQVMKGSDYSLVLSENGNGCKNSEGDAHKKDKSLSEETENSAPSSAFEEEIDLVGKQSSWMLENEKSDVASKEAAENFFGNLPSRIKQGIEHEEVDLEAMAERLVDMCVFYISQRKDDKFTEAEELIKLLLKEPKDLVTKNRRNDSEIAPNNIVREYELQILFRMEILRTEIGLGSEESMKQKFVKQICLLLEAMQCRLDGGFFGDWSIDKYVDRTIKARYNELLGEIVKKVYTEMDLLMFTDEELPDTSQSEQEHKHDTCEKTILREEAERESKRKHEDEKEEARKLANARERRERARRFACFTSWMPDLQRVWAPKQQTKTSKGNVDQKRKKNETSTGLDRVCETPMSGNKRSCSRTDCTSVSKALFQDEP